MNREHAKALAPIIKAFGDGEDVQVLNENMGWHSKDDYRFDAPHYHYRVKPKPKVIWANEYKDGCKPDFFLTPEAAKEDASQLDYPDLVIDYPDLVISRIAVKYVEEV